MLNIHKYFLARVDDQMLPWCSKDDSFKEKINNKEFAWLVLTVNSAEEESRNLEQEKIEEKRADNVQSKTPTGTHFHIPDRVKRESPLMDKFNGRQN